MKIIHIVTIILFGFLSGYAQDQPKNSDKTSEESTLPNDEFELQEELKVLRVDIEKLNQKIARWQRHRNQTERTSNDLDNQPVNSDSIISAIEIAIKNKQNDQQITLESQLVNLLFRSLFPPARSNTGFVAEGGPDFDYELEEFISNFETKISTSNQLIRSSPLYQRITMYNGGVVAPKFSGTDITQLKIQFSSEKLNAKRKEISKIFKDYLKEIDPKIKGFENIRSEKERRRNEISKKANKLRTSINELAIYLGLPLFCITIILLFLGPMIIRTFAKNAADTKAYSSAVLLELITVLLLTMSVLILGLADKIAGEVLGTLLGGISGYVLNRIRTKKETENQKTS